MIYFNAGWSSPLAPGVLEAVESVFRMESELGPTSLAGLRHAECWEERCRSSLARLLGCDPGDLLLTHGSQDGIARVLLNLSWGAGDAVVTTSLEHAALRDGCRVLASRNGVQIHTVEIGEGEKSKEAAAKIVKAVIHTRPRLVAVSHVQYGWGLYIPLETVREAARQTGALLLVDGAQSVGHLPVRLDEVQADFYTVSGQKWLGGPSGTGALFINRESRNVLEQPMDGRGWGSGGETHGHSPGGRHSLCGHSVALIAGLTAAVDALSTDGLAHLLTRACGLERLLRIELAGSPVHVVGPDAEECNGMLALRIDGATPDKLQSWLEDYHKIIVRRVAKASAVRLCITGRHGEDDIRLTAKALREAAELLPR